MRPEDEENAFSARDRLEPQPLPGKTGRTGPQCSRCNQLEREVAELHWICAEATDPTLHLRPGIEHDPTRGRANGSHEGG
jgi:hypothetical protein